MFFDLSQLFLLKNKCFGTTICTQCLQTNETQHCLGKEGALGAGGGVERVALIKSLIYATKKNALRALGCQVQLKMSADGCFGLLLNYSEKDSLIFTDLAF